MFLCWGDRFVLVFCLCLVFWFFFWIVGVDVVEVVYMQCLLQFYDVIFDRLDNGDGEENGQWNLDQELDLECLWQDIICQYIGCEEDMVDNDDYEIGWQVIGLLCGEVGIIGCVDIYWFQE